MTPTSGSDHWTQLEKLFYQALDVDPAARASFLDDACAGDAGLRQEVESLLESSQETVGFLRGMVSDAARKFTSKELGQRAGPYQLVGLLGAMFSEEVFVYGDGSWGSGNETEASP